MTGQIRYHAADAQGIARVEIAHPGKLNALSVAMWSELRSVFEALKAQAPAPRVVVVHGADGAFVAGADIEEFPRFRFDEESLRSYHDSLVAPALRAMLDVDVPLVAAIEGPCVGGGLEIAACCDLRVAGRGARFGIPVARLGFPVAPREAEILAERLGLPLVRELLLEARLLDAAEAQRRGVVQHVVDDDAVLAQARRLAERVAALSPQALALNKQVLRQIAQGGTNAELRDRFFAFADSREHREGIAAFLEKREPKF
ncbi:enoyl-CoA hydratase/isomerase family protein [Azohydromonas sediminis]|uniref:enoyl-CoA hydratase/isomerase family protein n=1 Tax=Azohydromonas sediminis TaxID=2259674 RepID=UPI000E655FF1|nr:enoyl-CoA hydratase-related protein [Azohydromonas sediminis]